MELTTNQVSQIKTRMLQAADKLKNLFSIEIHSKDQWQLYFEQVSAYFQLQSDEFYQILRCVYKQDPSAQKKIDFLQNDLKYLKVSLFECDESFLQHHAKKNNFSVIQKIKVLTQEVKERVLLEEKFLYPLMDESV